VNGFLWVLQILLALHTLMGAVWKVANTEQQVPSLKAIPHGGWLALSAFEVLCAVALILPSFNKPLAILAPIAALGIAAEMGLFTAVHLRSGDPSRGPMMYWLVVALVCAFVAYGRFVLKPL
jgi:hypothetical protein